MKLIHINPTQEQSKALYSISRACTDLWNMTLKQRRNKYSWGKTSLATHEQELYELKAEFSEYKLPHHQVLMNVFIAVDEAYQLFMPRRRQKGVKPPAFKSNSEFYTQRYTGDSFLVEETVLKLSYAESCLVFQIPEDDYSMVQWLELGYDDTWWVKLNN